jgi:DNA replication protein DnaC
MTTVESPGTSGYGWSMDDSERLRLEVARRAEKDAAREAARPTVPVGGDLTRVVLNLARKHAKDPTRIRPATDEEMAAAEQRTHQERLARQADILLRRLPLAYRDADMPSTEFGAAATRWLRDYAGGKRCNLAILGPVGSGKTWTACAVARVLLLRATVPVTVVTASEFLQSLRPAQGGLDVDMMQFVTAPVMVLDDLGTERLTEWAEEQLDRLAHDRSHNARPTVITSNLTPSQLKERYSRRTIERLFGGSQLIRIAGASRRTLPADFDD